ncbi:MAG: hypothetical protein EZS28_011669 [Streblomastix strix]|uniref:Uncharacterized protein n=1 Tax=Streblomastix strix TaxID=222440 RepID=A0A5J4WCW5_9EUKA|nr:MAG: hypothetical protein EZS28_011669 [Streblomastix strix]
MHIYDVKQLILTILQFLIITVVPLRQFFASNHWNICKVLKHCNTQEPFELTGRAKHARKIVAGNVVDSSSYADQSSNANMGVSALK